MNTNSKTFLQFTINNLSISENVLFSHVSQAVQKGEHIGLIGTNGSGKSTLLKLLIGKSKFDNCSVSTFGKISYVAQLDLDLYRSNKLLFEYLSEHSDDWWRVVDMYEKNFGKTLDTNQLINTLSGGEIVKINIALALSEEPDCLLLDEPTNHLDLHSMESLAKILIQKEITFILVSHNVSFLNEVTNRIWEVSGQTINTYGGNYDFYMSEKSKKIQAQENLYQATKKKFSKLETSLTTANVIYQEKAARRARKNKAKVDDLPRIMRKKVLNRGEKVISNTRLKLEKSLNELSNKLESLEIKKRKLAHLELSKNFKSGLLISIENGKLILPNEKILINDLNLKIYHGDRLAIMGDNGSGKTTLAKQLGYEQNKLIQGEIKYGEPYKTLYVDQKYDLVIPELNLIDNVNKYNPNLNIEEIRKILGNIGFISNEQVISYARELSGGETARLAFAIATSSTADLLVLDEPTNNLDIDTMKKITDALKQYKGAMVIISHDLSFIKKIGDTGLVNITL